MRESSPQGLATFQGDPFEVASIVLRENVSKEDVFAEQAKKPMSFQEVQTIVGEVEEGECSLEELLASID